MYLTLSKTYRIYEYGSIKFILELSISDEYIAKALAPAGLPEKSEFFKTICVGRI